jgi:hypothetical protein
MASPADGTLLVFARLCLGSGDTGAIREGGSAAYKHNVAAAPAV